MKDGYYWVKECNEWCIALICNDLVQLHAVADIFPLGWLDEIGDYIETPDKYKE